MYYMRQNNTFQAHHYYYYYVYVEVPFNFALNKVKVSV